MKHIKSRLAGPKSTTGSLGKTGSASTHIMKKRSANTYKVATTPRDPLGFSLNGTATRNISVGKESLFSRGPSCCVSTSRRKTIQSSVKNTKGMLANRFRWIKTPVPGYPTLQTIYNRWVSTEQSGYVETGTTDEHIRSKSLKTSICNDHKLVQPNSNKCMNEDNRTKKTTCVRPCGSRIQQKRNYPEHHAKFHRLIKDASEANLNAIERRAGFVIEPQGLYKPFPFNVPANSCNVLNADQATNPLILEDYFDQ